MISEIFLVQILISVIGLTILILNSKYKLFTIKLGNPLKTIILPIVIVFLIQLVQLKFFKTFEISEANLFASITLAPLFEEIIFRGYMIGIFYKLNRTSLWIPFSAILSSFLFAVFHNPFNTYRLILGLTFALLFIFSNKNILPSITAHFVNNWWILN